MAKPRFELDHLVVATRTLDDGVRWCESTLGVTPSGGGQHELMGTHNLLFSIASAGFPRAYFELIAIDPSARPPARRRWFGLDEPDLQQRLEREGPQLVHWIARTDRIHDARDTYLAQGIDPGVPTVISRGIYRWHITLRDDGLPQGRGAVPSLIQWDSDAHPSDALPASGIELVSLGLGDPVAPLLRATFSTPRGERKLAATYD